MDERRLARLITDAVVRRPLLWRLLRPRMRGLPLETGSFDLVVLMTAVPFFDELADRLDPDAVVIDLHMPIVDGVTAVARLRKDHPSLCLIALTGDDDSVLHEAVTEAGADAVLLKSDLVDSLVERLHAVRAEQGHG